jgi:hypothetical protein
MAFPIVDVLQSMALILLSIQVIRLCKKRGDEERLIKATMRKLEGQIAKNEQISKRAGELLDAQKPEIEKAASDKIKYTYKPSR